MNPGWVYLVHDAGTGLYRVGWAWQLRTHLKALAVQSVGEFRLLAYISTNDPRRLERHLKAGWAGKLVGEKWYKLDPADVALFRVTSAVRWKGYAPPRNKVPARDPLTEPPPSKYGTPYRRPPIRIGEPIARRVRRPKGE